MTTTLSTNGRVVIPHEIRSKCGLRKGNVFVVLCSSTGEIVLRRVRHPRKSWLKALRAMQGLELHRTDEKLN